MEASNRYDNQKQFTAENLPHEDITANVMTVNAIGNIFDMNKLFGVEGSWRFECRQPNDFYSYAAPANHLFLKGCCIALHGEPSPLGWLTLILVITLSAWFCLGRWEFGRIGRAAGQDGWNIQIKVNRTARWWFSLYIISWRQADKGIGKIWRNPIASILA